MWDGSKGLLKSGAFLLHGVLDLSVYLECLHLMASQAVMYTYVLIASCVADVLPTHIVVESVLETEIKLGTTFIVLYKLLTVLLNFTAH